MRQSEWTPCAPRILALVSACVVASLTTAPVLLKVRVTRVSTAEPYVLIVVDPV